MRTTPRMLRPDDKAKAIAEPTPAKDRLRAIEANHVAERKRLEVLRRALNGGEPPQGMSRSEVESAAAKLEKRVAGLEQALELERAELAGKG